jgi:hypothetical protein
MLENSLHKHKRPPRGFIWKHFESAITQLDQCLYGVGLEQPDHVAITKEEVK